MTESLSRFRKTDIILLAIIFAIGIVLRITPRTLSAGATLHFLAPLHPQPAWNKIGFKALKRQIEENSQ